MTPSQTPGPAWLGRSTRLYSAASADVGKRSAGQDFFNSWVSVAVAECITIPIDTVKVRLMLQGELGAKKQYNGGFDAFRTILKKEGPSGLFKGLAPALIRQSLYGTFRYGSYDQIKNSLGAGAGGNEAIPIWKKVLASCFAGGAGSFLAVPCDLVKIRMQADAAGTRYKSTISAFTEVDVAKSRIMNQHITTSGAPTYTGLLDCFSKTVKSEGVASLWKGFWPAYTRIGPRVIIIFVVLEQMRELNS